LANRQGRVDAAGGGQLARRRSAGGRGTRAGGPAPGPNLAAPTAVHSAGV